MMSRVESLELVERTGLMDLYSLFAEKISVAIRLMNLLSLPISDGTVKSIWNVLSAREVIQWN